MVRLTYKLLSEILLIFQHNGEIIVYWNGTRFTTISENDDIEDLKDLPEMISVEEDFYVQFPGEEEIEFDKALQCVLSNKL